MVQPQGAPQSSSEATEPAAGGGPPPHQGASGYPAQGYAHRLKYVVIGDSGSGKTALVRRFSKDVFQESQDCTIGVDLVVKTLVLPNGDEVNLQMWDTAGQERYRTVTRIYYRRSHGIVVAYDVNDKDSFDNVKHWMQEVQRYCHEDALTVIVGCKTDLRKGKPGQVAEGVGYGLVEEAPDSGQSWRPHPGELEELGAFGVYEASAKTGEGVQEVFRAMTEELVNRGLDKRNSGETVVLTQANSKQNSRCCSH